MSRAAGKERRKQQVLDAAEAAIRQAGTVDFSMRDLAKNADVSFATPFNLFGKKEDILAALFHRRVTAQAERRKAESRTHGGLENLLQIATETCTGYLADAELFKPLAQAFRTQRTPQLEAISSDAQHIWRTALENCLADKVLHPDTLLDSLARRLHISFRVAFLMWATNELPDKEFEQQVLFNLVGNLLAHTTPKGRKSLLGLIENDGRFLP